MISADCISKTFRGKKTIQALKQITLKAEDGKITALLGPNGAGKTTFLRILAGLENSDEGTLHVSSPNLRSRNDFAFLSEGCGLYPRLTGYENIRYFAELNGLTKSEADKSIAGMSEHLGLTSLLDRAASQYSQGERMRILIARSIVHQPKNIVLDEPTNGLDIASVRKLRAFLKYLSSPVGGSRCVLFSTHVMHEVEKLADKVIVIVGGEIKAEGTQADILNKSGETDFEEAFVKLAFEGLV